MLHSTYLGRRTLLSTAAVQQPGPARGSTSAVEFLRPVRPGHAHTEREKKKDFLCPALALIKIHEKPPSLPVLSPQETCQIELFAVVEDYCAFSTNNNNFHFQQWVKEVVGSIVVLRTPQDSFTCSRRTAKVIKKGFKRYSFLRFPPPHFSPSASS